MRPTTTTQLPGEADVAKAGARRGFHLGRAPWSVLGVVALGGVIGAEARYGLAIVLPHQPHRFPWATFVTNVVGCVLIGVLMVLITEVWAAHRLLRPFLGVGVLGGFTTFSTYAVEVQRLVSVNAARTGLVYLLGTPLAALAAVCLGIVATRFVSGSGSPASRRRAR